MLNVQHSIIIKRKNTSESIISKNYITLFSSAKALCEEEDDPEGMRESKCDYSAAEILKFLDNNSLN